MGLAKKRMFGEKPSRWPRLQAFVKKGVLLDIDLAYAETQVKEGTEEEAATHAALLALSRMGHLCLKKECISDPDLAKMVQEGASLSKNDYFENQIVNEIKRLLSYPKKTLSPLEIEGITEEQFSAVKKAFKYPLTLITGGPGTGKTTTAAAIVKAFSTKTILAAPTGRAAKHLESKISSEVNCQTLHSLLEVYNPEDYRETVSPLDAKLIIVDECSMIDPPLFGRLLSAIGPETTLVLMGDINQLPAVEGGSVFADLIEAKKIPTTFLTKCHRSDRVEILDLAQSILKEKKEDIRNIDLGFSQGGIETIYLNLWNHVKDRDFTRFRILSTLRKGPFGVDALNAFLYEQFSKQTDRFPIMITRNDPQTGLWNGDMGIVQNQKAYFSDGREFLIEEIPPYEYAYCLSVHKSQGSEYDHILFLIPEGSDYFGKELLYTGVTRAREALEIDGDLYQIISALGRNSRKASQILKKLK